MKICIDHWTMIRESVKAHGMDHLGAKSGEQAIVNTVRELEGKVVKDDFDPNMSHHRHWANGALEQGGLYLMGESDHPKINEGQYCPVCEFVSHYDTFKDKEEIDKVSKQMQNYCKEHGLL